MSIWYTNDNYDKLYRKFTLTSFFSFYYLAMVSYDLGLKDKAEEYYRQLIDRNPSSVNYYNGLVKVLELSKDNDS